MTTEDEIFNIVPDKDKLNSKIYRLQFKHDLSIHKGYMATTEWTMRKVARRWMRNNNTTVDNILFELNVLRDDEQK